MAEPDLSAPADTVRRLDPALFATALFAREPGRERLMILYAYDIELSRAADRVAGSETGPIIAAMRVQFWRDVVAAAEAGEPPRAHDIAEPLAGLIAAIPGLAGAARALADARDREIEGVGAEDFDAWAEARFAALVDGAARCPGVDGTAAAAPAGRALARAFALRTARPMAEAQRALLPGIDAGALARGTPSADDLATVAETARAGLAALSEARAAGAPRAALPAFLPLWRAEVTLRTVAARPAVVLDGPAEPGPARRAAALAWRAATGRW